MNCIICGKKLGRVRYYGFLRGMRVCTCCEHIGSLGVCDKISMEIDVKKIPQCL